MSARIGVFICECGPNIKAVVDVDQVAAYASGLKTVVLARTFGLMCSVEGRTLLQQEIQQHRLDRIVIAGCSPKEHEHTFKQILQKAGLNPFMLQVANLREQCAWVHDDHATATDKAQFLVRAAIQRVLEHEPIETKKIACQPDVLIVGAGVAGLSAALTLAQHDRRVFIVEKAPCIGGNVALFEDLYPNLECAACVLDPLLDQALHHERIEILTLSEVQAAVGYYGNFKITVQTRARSVDATKCIGCGMCIATCPIKAPNEFNAGLDERGAIYLPYPGALPHVALIDRNHCLHFQGNACNLCREACQFDAVGLEDQDTVRELEVGAVVLSTGYALFDPRKAPQYGYGRHEDIYTAFEFERLLNSNGATEGRIEKKNGQTPRSIVFVPCVGSRSDNYHPYCSGICCLYNLKFMHQMKMKQPEVQVLGLFADLCLPGKTAQQFYNRVSETEGITIARLNAPDAVTVTVSANELLIEYADPDGRVCAVSADMIVLAPAMEGARDAQQLAKTFDVLQDEAGFLIEEHQALAPVATINEGIFIAGCAQGPKDIPGSVAQGQAAAGRILSRLTPGAQLELEPLTAKIDTDLCSGCRVCVDLCAYKALQVNANDQTVAVEPTLCRGCGLCAAACPAGAITARHYCDRMIEAELQGLMS